MPTFEEGFSAAESAADAVLACLNDAASITRQLRKSSQEGNIAAVRRHSERLGAMVSRIGQEINNASSAWPFTADEEREYLEEGYNEELKDVAQKKGPAGL